MKLKQLKSPYLTRTKLQTAIQKSNTVNHTYLAINDDYYIQLRIHELRMCKQIRHTYYCEELFLVKHKSKHSCESAVFYNLTSSVVYSVSKFDYYYNMTVNP